MNHRDLETEQRLKRRLEELSRTWRDGDGPEPPDLVDQAVLNRARRAVEPPFWRRPARWMQGLAATAVVVLALVVVVQQRPPEPALTPAMPPPPSPAARGELRDAADPGVDGAAARQRVDGADEGAARLRAAKSTGAERAPEVEGATGAAREPSADAAPESPVPAALQRTADSDAVGEREALAEEASAFRAEAAAADAPQDEAPPDMAPLPSPEAWLERLEALRAAGDEAAFERELARFRDAYPEQPLPDGWVR